MAQANSETDNPSTQDWEFVQRNQQLGLSVRARLAWATAIVERVLNLYSPIFRSATAAGEAIEYAWRYSLGGEDFTDVRRQIMQKLEKMLPEFEAKGYEYFSLYPAFALLSEIEVQDARGTDVAVMYCGGAYMSAILYRHGGKRVRGKFQNEIQIPYLRFVWQTFKRAQAATGAVDRQMFDGVQLGLDPQIPPDEEIQKKGPPPAEEVIYLNSLSKIVIDCRISG